MSVNILVSCVRFLLSSVFPPDVEPADAERSGLTLRLHEAALSSVRDRHMSHDDLIPQTRVYDGTGFSFRAT